MIKMVKRYTLAQARKKLGKTTQKAISVNLADIGSLLMIGVSSLDGAGGNVIDRAKSGNYLGAIEAIPSNLWSNRILVLSGIGVGVGGKVLRKKRLSPSVGVPKVVKVNV